MTDPLTLFDLPANPLPCRTSDPETSKAAAKQLDVRQRQGEVLRALRWLGVASTAEQVRDCLAAHGMDREKGEVRSRLAELYSSERWADHAPRVRKVGVRRGDNHRGQTTWALTTIGMEIAKGLDG